MFRSTKGASKQRRDLINSEISVLRDLLPLPDTARQRLSQLQIMSLACVYIRKCNFFSRLFGEGETSGESAFDFSQTMVGFLLVASRDGKLLYISDNVTEYLGHSMVDMMTQGDSVYDILDKRDHPLVQNHLMSGPATTSQTPPGQVSEERTFFCRMNVARSFRRQAGFGDHKMMHVKGHFMQPVIRDHYGNQPVFMAICSPLITPDVKETVIQNSTNSFYSVHSLDMKYTEIGHIGQHHLAYDETELVGKSWYELLHPEDLHEAKEKHIQLIKSSHEMGCMLTTRLQSKYGSWVWVNVVMHIRQPFVCDNGEPAIVCINHVIDDAEAQQFKIQSQLYSSHIARSPEFLGSPPQSASPSHTITQVPTEGSSYPPQGYSRQTQSQAGEDLIYSIDILAAGTSLDTTSQQPPAHESHHTIPHGSTNLYADSSSDSSIVSQGTVFGCPPERKILRADVVNKLKRKISDSSNGQQCRPRKIAHIATSGGNGGTTAGSGATSYQASALIANVSLFDGLRGGDFSGFGAGDIQVLAPMQDGPVYQQLVLKKDSLLQQKGITVGSSLNLTSDNYPKPPTPLSPDSLTTEHPRNTSELLTIDVTETHAIPSSLLTPDASPLSVSNDEMYGSPLSNSDQTLETVTSTEMSDTLFFDDVSHSKSEKHIFVVDAPKAAEERLPIIDTISLETMLGELERKSAEVPTANMSSATSHPRPGNLIAQTVNTLSLPENNEDLLTQAVTNVLMDMVQEASIGGIDLSQFMVVPTDVPQVTESPLGQSMMDMGDDPLSGLPQMSMITGQATVTGEDFTLLEELHQLAELNLPPPPPYGEVDLPSSLFA